MLYNFVNINQLYDFYFYVLIMVFFNVHFNLIKIDFKLRFLALYVENFSDSSIEILENFDRKF